MGTPSATGWDGILPPGVRPLEADDPVRLGGHTLIGRLGSGGMGVVYLGQNPVGGFVAIKSANATDEETVRRFEAEVACLRRVPPACTSRLIADGTGRRPPYIVTEYVEGRSLEQLVETGGPLQPEQVTALATGVGRALAAIHEAGLIHRDLKPANILLTPTGPRVIDFGISKQVGAAGGLTGPGLVVGSPGWIPPERLNRYPATPASDVFGWGCLVAYAGTGRNPFGRGDAEEIVRRTLEEPPDLDGIESPLRGLVAQALTKEPAARPSAAWILSRLVPSSEGTARYPAAIAAPTMARHAPERSDTKIAPVTVLRRRRWPVLAGAAATVAAVLIGVITTVAGGHETPLAPPSAGPSVSPSDDAAARPAHTTRSIPRDQSGESVADRRPTHHGGHKGKGGKGGGGGKGGHGHG